MLRRDDCFRITDVSNEPSSSILVAQER